MQWLLNTYAGASALSDVYSKVVRMVQGPTEIKTQFIARVRAEAIHCGEVPDEDHFWRCLTTD